MEVEQLTIRRQPVNMKPARRAQHAKRFMTLVSDAVSPPSSVDVDRNLALLAYGLLFFAIFFAGVPAVIAVLIAYSRRGLVDRAIASHHRFQITIFWVGFALTALAAICGVAAVIAAVIEMIKGAMGLRLPGWQALAYRTAQFRGPVALFSIATVGFGILTGLWLQATSCYGFIRLALRRPIRRAAA